MKLYKLTDQKYQTKNSTQWGENIEHVASGEGELCSSGFLHAYLDPLLAVLLNPIHANIENIVLWEAEGEVAKEDHGLKVGCTKLKTIKVIPLPKITIEQKIKFGILCALEVCKEDKFVTWANKWLSGEDRTRESAYAVFVSANASANVSANASANVSFATAFSASAVYQAAATYVITNPADAIYYTNAAADAVYSAAAAADVAYASSIAASHNTIHKKLDLIALAKEACA